MRKFLSFFLLAGLMAWAGVANAQQEFTTGTMSSSDSTNLLPVSSWHCYSLTQMVINHGQMPYAEGKDFKINSISFYNTGHTNGLSAVPRRKIVVYMRNVSHAYFTSATDYFTLADTDRVFVGTWDISSAGWNTIDLQKQFVYKNVSSNHLLIAIYDSTGTYQGHYFRCWNRRSGAQVLSYRGDSNDPNPEAILSGYSGSKDTFQTRLPVLKIGYTIDSVSTATLPYTTNFSDATDNQKWYIKNWTDYGFAGWSFYTHGNQFLMCGIGQDDYNTDNHAETSLAERKLLLDNSDSIRVSFRCNVDGESSATRAYDYLAVFIVPEDTNWAPTVGGTPYYVGFSGDSIMPYALYFGEHGRLASFKLAHLNNQVITSTFVNPFPGRRCKLVFVWRNDSEDGNGTAPSIDDLSVIGINRTAEYTPRSTAQWFAYAYKLYGENNSWQNHFLKFSMQNPANADTASAPFGDDILSGTYAGNYVWYNQGAQDKITCANISNNFISGAIDYTLASPLPTYISAMQYNPADNKMYFFTTTNRLYSFDLSDPEHNTAMGIVDFYVAGFAINAQGEAYVLKGYNDDGPLYRVNLNNGTTTLVGNTGIYVEPYSSMAFDYNTGELFAAIYDNNNDFDYYGKTALFHVNTSNAEMKYIGKLLGCVVEVSALFAVQTVPTTDIATAQAAELSVYPNPAKDELRVNGVENGTVLLVYDMTGKIVAQQTATENTVINVSGLNKGVYVVAAGERKIKFVKE